MVHGDKAPSQKTSQTRVITFRQQKEKKKKEEKLHFYKYTEKMH